MINVYYKISSFTFLNSLFPLIRPMYPIQVLLQYYSFCYQLNSYLHGNQRFQSKDPIYVFQLLLHSFYSVFLIHVFYFDQSVKLVCA